MFLVHLHVWGRRACPQFRPLRHLLFSCNEGLFNTLESIVLEHELSMFVLLFTTDLSLDLLLRKTFLTRSLPVEIEPDFFFGISGYFIQDSKNDLIVRDGFVKHLHLIVAAITSC